MPRQKIIDFLNGSTDIVSFRKMYDEQPEINAFLQKIIDDLKAAPDRKPIPYTSVIGGKEHSFSITVPYLIAPEKDPGRFYNPTRYESVRKCLTYENGMITHNVRTAFGAFKFYSEVYEIYLQIDQSIDCFDKYSDEFDFAITVIPQYLSGGEAEMYIQQNIIPLFPETMKKTERKKAIKAKIKEEFKSEKGYPAWPQSSEWPMDKTGRPATYIGKGKSEGDLRRFRFRDESTGEIIVVEQAY